MAESSAPSDLVSAIMSTKVVTVKSTDRVSKALQTMVRHKIGSIVVVEKRRPIGILTERDFFTRMARRQDVRGLAVGKIMSKPLVTVGPSVEVTHAVEQMVRKGVRRLPVMDGDRLVGIITERDVFRYLIGVAYAPNVPEDLRKLIETRAQAQALIN